MLNVAAPLLVTAKEGKLPPVKFAMTMPAGVAAVGSGDPLAAVKVASRLLLPRRIETVLSPWFTTARSGTVSVFRSPVPIATGDVPTLIGEFGASVKAIFKLESTELSKIDTLFVAWFTTARSTSGALFTGLLFARKLAVTMATG